MVDVDEQDATADRTMLLVREGRPWPVVMCGRDILLLEEFANSCPDGVFVKVLPAILLGRHKFVWVKTGDLLEYNHSREYFAGSKPFSDDRVLPTDSKAIKYEKQRRMAFRDEAPNMEFAGFRGNYIDQARGAREIEDALNRKEGRKGKRSHSASVNGHGASERLLKRAKHQPPKGHAPPAVPGLSSNAKRPLQSAGFTLITPPKSSASPDSGYGDYPKTYSEEMCTILVGKDQRPFDVPLLALRNFKAFQERVSYNKGSRNFVVMLSSELDISPADTFAVHEFLIHGDLKPQTTRSDDRDVLRNTEDE